MRDESRHFTARRDPAGKSLAQTAMAAAVWQSQRKTSILSFILHPCGVSPVSHSASRSMKMPLSANELRIRSGGLVT